MRNGRLGAVARTCAVMLALLVTVTACAKDPGSATGVALSSSTPTTTTPPYAAGSASSSVTSRTSDQSTASAVTSAELPTFMPDFVGGTVDQAEAVLKPLNVRIKTQNRISTEAAGTVIEQNPVAGADFAQSVTLTVSIAPPTVPDVTQQTFGTAQQTLTKLGFTVKENPVFDEKLADGLVTEQSPPAGATNASEITLSVVRRPVATYLSDMTPVASEQVSGPHSGVQKSNGKSYSHGIALTPYSNAIGSVEYDFSRQYRQLTGEVGLDDKANSSAVGKVEIYGDGRLLKEQDVPFGTTSAMDVDVTDVLRLRISISVVNGDAAVILGDVRAQGLQSEVTTTATSVG